MCVSHDICTFTYTIEYTYMHTNHTSLSKIKAKCFDFCKQIDTAYFIFDVCVCCFALLHRGLFSKNHQYDI